MGRFFFEEVERIEKQFIDNLNAIPQTAQQTKSQILSQASGAKRLERFGDLVLIDQLVKIYPRYSHDDVFDMELVFILELFLLNKTQSYIQSGAYEQQRKNH